MTTYTDAKGNKMANSVAFSGNTTVPYPYGTVLSDTHTTDLLTTVITQGNLPLDPSGVYMVLTSGDVTPSGFCSDSCSYHDFFLLSGTSVRYAVVGNPVRCLDSCALPNVVSTGPNGNAGADAMVVGVAHELVQTANDPERTGWYVSSTGMESVDLCAFTTGAVRKGSCGRCCTLPVWVVTRRVEHGDVWVCGLAGDGVNKGGGPCKCERVWRDADRLCR